LPELPVRFASVVAKYRQVLLATTVVSAVALPQIVNAFDGTGRIIVAQREDPKKKQQQPKPQPKQVPPKQVQQPKPAPQQKQVQPPKQMPAQKQVQPAPQKQMPPTQKQVQPPAKAPLQQQQAQPQQPSPKADPKGVQPQPKLGPKADPRTVQPQPGVAPKADPRTVQPQPGIAPKADPKTVQPQPGVAPKADPKTVQPQPGVAPKADPKTVQPQPGVAPKTDPRTVQPQPKLGPKADPKTVQPQPGVAPKTDPKTVQPPAKAPPVQQQTQPPQLAPKADPRTVQPQPKVAPRVAQPPVQVQKFGAPKAAPAAQVRSVTELKGKRQEQRQGNTVIIREPGNRTIIRENNKIVIRHDESERMRRWGNAKFETRGRERYTIVNRGGYDVYTITDDNGRLLRRYRRFPDGREYALIDNRRRWGPGAAVAAGAVVGGAIALGLAMPRVTIPREQYIVDVDQAPPAMLYDTLDAPPLVPMERPYSLDEVRDNYELRARVRSVDINTINFSSGSWEISPDQVQRLQGLAEAMQKVISENPSTVFLIEGHTDAVGDPEDNASLSDRRAESVAEALTTNFNVPPENLVTQGYGEQHLRVQTEGSARENRRVEVRNVTGLMAAQGEPAEQGGAGGTDEQGAAPPDAPAGQPPG
jgi:outer membrane protein OmpA-like peptidoglycan-associated protein